MLRRAASSSARSAAEPEPQRWTRDAGGVPFRAPAGRARASGSRSTAHRQRPWSSPRTARAVGHAPAGARARRLRRPRRPDGAPCTVELRVEPSWPAVDGALGACSTAWPSARSRPLAVGGLLLVFVVPALASPAAALVAGLRPGAASPLAAAIVGAPGAGSRGRRASSARPTPAPRGLSLAALASPAALLGARRRDARARGAVGLRRAPGRRARAGRGGDLAADGRERRGLPCQQPGGRRGRATCSRPA